MSDGSIKAEEAHSSLLQSSDVQFTACGTQSIIDNALQAPEKGLTFDICQAYYKDEFNERKLVYDTINDYFKVIISAEQLHDVCDGSMSQCHLEVMKAKVIDPDLLYIEIGPPIINSPYMLNVNHVLPYAPYGKVSMINSKQSRKRHTTMKIELEHF